MARQKPHPLLIAAGALAAVKLLGSKPARKKKLSEAKNPTSRPNETDVGLAIDESGGVYVSSWPRWMEFAPEAFERAITDGEVGAENVLLHVLQRALPRAHWPPPEGSAQEKQYRSLVKVVAEWLTLEPEPEKPGLRVVK